MNLAAQLGMAHKEVCDDFAKFIKAPHTQSTEFLQGFVYGYRYATQKWKAKMAQKSPKKK